MSDSRTLKKRKVGFAYYLVHKFFRMGTLGSKRREEVSKFWNLREGLIDAWEVGGVDAMVKH